MHAMVPSVETIYRTFKATFTNMKTTSSLVAFTEFVGRQLLPTYKLKVRQLSCSRFRTL